MAPLLSTHYRPEFFSNIPHFENQIPKLEILDLPSVLKKIGQVFLKHKAQKDFALIVVHRHFLMDSGEILVDMDSSSGLTSVAIPWKFVVKDGQAECIPKFLDYFNSQGLNPNEAVSIEPKTWAFEKFGSLFPFEFQASREKNELDLKPIDPEFAAELFQLLKKLGLQKMFGICRKSRNFWETTDIGMRANISHHGSEIPPELQLAMKVIYWSFNSKGEANALNWCAHCCAHGGGTSCGCK